jgi:hypothetical protein
MDPTLTPPDSTASLDGQTGLDAQTGVGLSDAQLSQSRRRTLDLVNRLHSTGFVIVPTAFFFPPHSSTNLTIFEQSLSRHRSAPDRCRRPTELWKVIADRVRIWYHFASCRGYLYKVCHNFIHSFLDVRLTKFGQVPDRMPLEG